MPRTFGQVIADERKKLGISLRELSERIHKDDAGGNISAQYLNDIELGRRNPPGGHLIREIARELKLDPDYLTVLANELPEHDQALVQSAEPQQVKDALTAFRKSFTQKPKKTP